MPPEQRHDRVSSAILPNCAKPPSKLVAPLNTMEAVHCHGSQTVTSITGTVSACSGGEPEDAAGSVPASLVGAASVGQPQKEELLIAKVSSTGRYPGTLFTSLSVSSLRRTECCVSCGWQVGYGRTLYPTPGTAAVTAAAAVV